MMHVQYGQITYQESEDLGRAAIKYVTPLEFQILIPHIATILHLLWRENFSRSNFVYAFEFSSGDRKAIELVMMSADLPEHVYFYETDDRKLFEMRGASGGITTGLICYLITK